MSETYKYRHTKTDKFEYPDGVGGSLWIVSTNCKDPKCDCDDCGCGLCFDFGEDNVDDIIVALVDWKLKQPTIYEEDKEYEEAMAKADIRESKLWYKVYNWFTDITFTFRPFQWDFYFKIGREYNMFFSIPSLRSRGVMIGPFQFTLPRFGKKKKEG